MTDYYCRVRRPAPPLRQSRLHEDGHRVEHGGLPGARIIYIYIYIYSECVYLSPYIYIYIYIYMYRSTERRACRAARREWVRERVVHCGG